jgi:hypothetical protein
MNKLIPVLLLIALFAAAAWFSFTKEPDPVHEVLPSELPAVAPVIREPTQLVQPNEDITVELEPELITIPDPLPLLNESDDFIRHDLAEIVGAESLVEYLIKSQVISRMVSTIDGLTSRQVAPQMNPVKSAEGQLVVDTDGDAVTISAQNFARYDGYVAMMQSASTETVIGMYEYYAPLFQTAWEENGGQGQFNDRLLEVIDSLLETPDVPGPVYLTKYEAVYLFTAPELEAMTAGQKILVRMGSLNAEVVKEKLRLIRDGLAP